ncbi:MAG: hypothetical protein ACFHU9_02075 [Fluviicola sp.]
MSKEEKEFYTNLEKRYNCRIQRYLSEKDEEEQLNQYSIVISDFPDSIYRKGKSYLETEGFFIAESLHTGILKPSNQRYNEILVGFNTIDEKNIQFVYRFE